MATLRFGGGLNQLDHESDAVSVEECIEGENFLLNPMSRDYEPRPAFDLKGTATNGGVVRGIMQLVKRDNSETTLVQADEAVYEWDGASSFTPKTPTSTTPVTTSSQLRGTYWSLDELLVITDLTKASPVWQWDGSTMTEMTHAITGVSKLYAKYSIVFQGRVWLFNITTDSDDNPHMILASEFENYDNFDNAVTPAATTITYSDPFFLLTPDLKGINGVATFFNTILISTDRGELFRLTGTDARDYAVTNFYAGSASTGLESMVNIGNDITFIRAGGRIERVGATEQFGDAASDDLSTRIPDEVADLEGAISIYDQRNERVCFFASNKVLMLDKFTMETRPELSPWMKWTTQMTSNLDVEAAVYLRRPGTTNYSVYFGGPSGQIYDLNGSGTADGGSTLIKVFRKTPLISELGTVDDFIQGRITYQRITPVNFTVLFEWTDEYTDTISVIPLKDEFTSIGTYFWGSDTKPSYFGQDNYWNQAGVIEDRISTIGFSTPGKGPSFFLITTVNTDKRWLVHKIETAKT